MAVARPTAKQMLHVLKPALMAGFSLAAPTLALGMPINPLDHPDVPPAKYAAITLSEEGSYDSNPLRLVHNTKSLKGSESTAELLLNTSDPTTLFQLRNIISQGLYDNSIFNSTNAHEYLSIGRKNQRWDATLNGRFDYDTTRSTEITSFGITAPNVRNKVYSIIPGLTFRVNKRDSFGTTFNYLKSTYDNAVFVDYTSMADGTYWKHRLDTRNSAVLTVNAQQYQTNQGAQNTTTSIGPTVGWVWEYSDALTAHIDVGEQTTQQKTQNGTPTSSQSTYVYSGALNYRTQRYITDAKVQRAQQPAGNGLSILLTDLKLKESYLVSDRLSLRGSVGYRKASYVVQPIATNLDHEYNASAGIAYRLMKDLDATGTFSYIRQGLIGNGAGTLDSQSVIVGLSYHPPEDAL